MALPVPAKMQQFQNGMANVVASAADLWNYLFLWNQS